MFQLNCGHEESWLYWLMSVLWLLGGLFQGHCYVCVCVCVGGGGRNRERVREGGFESISCGWVGRKGGGYDAFSICL